MEKLGFARCRLSLAVPKSVSYSGTEWLQGKRIATSYPGILKRFLTEKILEADIHEISGAWKSLQNRAG
jgi:ATP phosphoribosyltransferase